MWRPADGLETALAWAHAVERPIGERPSVLILSLSVTYFYIKHQKAR